MMKLKQCLENLKRDINDGVIEDDTFATICYITMANEARRLLASELVNQQAANDAREYLATCCGSGNDTLRFVAGK